MRINAININENGVAIEWHLRSNKHRSLKGEVLNNDKLSEEGLLAFMFTAMLGDGNARIIKDSYGND